MKNLTFDLWSVFYKQETGKFDGIKFEDLVAQLLFLEYPNYEWKRTQPSWDGKRDFYAEHKIDEKKLIEWAECKIYNKNLSINIISPTLIMSTLENINEIVFFSYSKFNKNAVEILSRFSKEHNKKIILYDDEKLENLIFKHRDKIEFKKFFPLFQDKQFDFTPEIKISESIYIHSKNCTYSLEEIKNKSIKINEVFDLIVTIENKSLKREKVCINMDLKNGDMYKYFQFANKTLVVKDNINLLPCQITSFIIHLKLIGYKKQIAIPEIIVCYKNKSITLSSIVNVSWLVEIPLIAYNGWLDNLNKYIIDDAYCVGCIHGTSGVGKTRFLQEIHKNNLLCGIKSTYINSYKNSSNMNWIKRLISEYYNLPILSLNKDELEYNLISDDTEKNLVMNILYNDKFNFQDNISKISTLILKILSSEKRVVLIDNVQDFSHEMIMVLNELINYNDIINETNLILSFNTDYISMDSIINDFYNKILSLCGEYKENYLEIPLSGFDSKQSRVFINSCFGYNYLKDRTNFQYDTYIDKISKVSQNKPLFIEQILIHLCTEGIIFVNDDHFSILDNDRFELEVNTLPLSLNNYFEKRYDKLKKKHLDNIKEINSTLRLLCFLEYIPNELQLSMNLNEECIDILEKFGIIKLQNGIVFYHQLLHKYFKNKFPSPSIKEYSRCKVGLELSQMDDDLSAQYYFCMLKTSKVSNRLLIDAITTLTNNNVPNDLVPEYCKILFTKIKLNGYDFNNENLTKNIIIFYTNYCYVLRDHVSYDEGLKQYENFYNNYVKKIEQFKRFGKEIYKFILGYLNILLTLHKNESVITIGEHALNKIILYQFYNVKEKQNAIIMLYNRIHIAYYRLQCSSHTDYRKISQEYIRKSLRKAKATNNTFYIIQNEIDLGYIYYSDYSSKKRAATHWDRSYEILKERKDSKAWRYGVYFHKALAEAIRNNYYESVKWIEKVYRIFKREIVTPYYYNKACLLDAIIAFFTQDSHEVIFDKIKYAENRCQINNLKLGYSICSHLKAIFYQFYEPDIEKSKMYYKKAINQYFQKWSENELILHKNFIIDLIDTLYKIDENVILLNDEVNRFYISNKPKSKKYVSFIYHKKKKINFPCV